MKEQIKCIATILGDNARISLLDRGTDENEAWSYQAIINQDKRSFHDKLDQLKLKPSQEQKLDGNLYEDISNFLFYDTQEVMATFSLGHICEASVEDYNGGDNVGGDYGDNYGYYRRKRRSSDWYSNYGDDNGSDGSNGSDYGAVDCSLRLVYDCACSTLVITEYL